MKSKKDPNREFPDSFYDKISKTNYRDGAKRKITGEWTSEGRDYSIDYFIHNPWIRGKSYIAGIARQALNDAAEFGDMELALKSAQLYDKIGKAVKRRDYINRKFDETVNIARMDKKFDRKISNKMSKFISELEQKTEEEPHKILSGVLMILGITGGLILLSGNITGNIVGNSNQIASNWIGGVLLIVGLIGGYFLLKRK